MDEDLEQNGTDQTPAPGDTPDDTPGDTPAASRDRANALALQESPVDRDSVALVDTPTAVLSPAADSPAPDSELDSGEDRLLGHALVLVAPALPALPAARTKAVLLPLTHLAALLLASMGLALVAAAAGLALALTAGDWGSGARVVGFASLALGVMCLGANLARSIRGRQRIGRLGIAVAVMCGLLGGGALAAAHPLRLAQGHQLEASHDWPGALRAYLLAGEQGPAGDDPARVYIEWGDDLAAQAQYAGAVDRYEQAIVRYPLALAQARRAIARLWPVYAAWISGPSSTPPYDEIVLRLSGYQRDAWCDGNCQAAAAALEAQARFTYGLELASEQQYPQAIQWLEGVRAADPFSQYVARAHAAAATVYYALGQTQLHGPTCTAALPTFVALATSYKDTPEGKRASVALAAPVRVSGRLTGYPTSPAPTMYLSTKIYSSSHFSDDYNAALDTSGNFMFAQVRSGTYNLSAAFGDGSGRSWQTAQSSNPYSVVVAPLCALNLGTYSW